MINTIDNNELNDNNDDIVLAEEISRLLSETECTLSLNARGKLARFVALIREWNDYASLVSTNDIDRMADLHLVDSLSLVSIIARLGKTRGILLDIGSGGGFPAIPLAIALPNLRISLVERSTKKIAFLRKAVAALDLENTSVVEGAFPEAGAELQPDVITARAVEIPEKLVPEILAFLPENATFICQVPQERLKVPPMFHVEHVQDEWTSKGLRRGSLYLVSHA